MKKRRQEKIDEDEPTLRQLMQPELVEGVDSHPSERHDNRARIEPRL